MTDERTISSNEELQYWVVEGWVDFDGGDVHIDGYVLWVCPAKEIAFSYSNENRNSTVITVAYDRKTCQLETLGKTVR